MKNDANKLWDFLQERQQKKLYRAVKISESAQQPSMQIDGKTYLTFCSNNYLGLANHPEIVKAFQQSANHYGVGSGAAHLINGHSREHQLLEEELAEFTGRDRALLFSNGYMANLGVIQALLERGDYLLQDRLNHASLIDAGLLSHAKMSRYHHNNTSDLSQRLSKLVTLKNTQNTMIATDGVFSMDGDTAPITALAELAQQYQAWLMVDDAHGFGALGKTGAGLLEQEKLDQTQVSILMATLGKACGTAGAFVAGSHELIEFLTQTARTFIYTTAQPAAIAAATRISLKLIQSETWRREKLASLITYFKQGASELGLSLLPSDTAIQPIMVGDNETALSLAQHLEQQGILVTPIRPPTVPVGSSRLRITLSAEHNQQQLDQLLDALEKTQKQNTD